MKTCIAFLIALVIPVMASTRAYENNSGASLSSLMEASILSQEIVYSDAFCEIIKVQTSKGTFWKVISTAAVESIPYGIQLVCMAKVKRPFVCEIIKNIAAQIIKGISSEGSDVHENLSWASSLADGVGTGIISAISESKAFEVAETFLDFRTATRFPWTKPQAKEVNLRFEPPKSPSNNRSPQLENWGGKLNMNYSDFGFEPSSIIHKMVRTVWRGGAVFFYLTEHYYNNWYIVPKKKEADNISFGCCEEVGRGVAPDELYKMVLNFRSFVGSGGQGERGEKILLGDELSVAQQGMLRTNFRILDMDEYLVAVIDLTPKSIIFSQEFDAGFVFTDQGIYYRFRNIVRIIDVRSYHWSCMRNMTISWNDSTIEMYYDPPGIWNECKESFYITNSTITIAEYVKLFSDICKL